MTDWQLQFLLSCLEKFASEDFQERVWRRGEGPEVSSYEEAMCQLFDDGRVDDIVEREWMEVGLTALQRDHLAAFRDSLNAFDHEIPDTPSPAMVLDHPDWPALRRLAQNTLSTLRP